MTPNRTSILEIIRNVNASMDDDVANSVAHCINLYGDSMYRLGGRYNYSAADVRRLFTIVDHILTAGQPPEQSYAPKKNNGKTAEEWLDQIKTTAEQAAVEARRE